MKNLIEQIGIQNIFVYLVIINIIGFLAMGIDKRKAKKNRKVTRKSSTSKKKS